MRNQSQPLTICPAIAGCLQSQATLGAWLLGLAALNLASGCTSEACQGDTGIAIRYAGGTTSEAGTQYETSGWDGPWLTFPSGIRYRLEHHLRARPVDMNIWLSLDDKPFEQGEDTKQAVTPGAGNQSWILSVTDKGIVVHNDTCADLFIRVTAWTTDSDNPEHPTRDAAQSLSDADIAADAGANVAADADLDTN